MKYIVQFGGQGAPWIKELARYYNEPTMAKFFGVIVKSIEEIVSSVANTGAIPQGFDIKSWLQSPDTAPDDNYLSRAAISLPMIQAAQLAHLEYLHVNGLTRQKLVQNTFASTGHSQGLIPATLLALNLDDAAYYEALATYTKYLFYVGVRAQQVSTTIFASDAENTLSESVGTKSPEPMVAVLGLTSNELNALVQEMNASLPQNEKIYLSLYNTGNNTILSSTRNSLIKFNEKINPMIADKKVKYVYLKTSCPFHSPLLENIKESFEKDIETLNMPFKGSDLKIPVYSFSDGRNMQADDKLSLVLYKELMINPLYWEKALKSSIENHASVELVLDFGPGKVSQRLSQEVFQGLGKEINIATLAMPKEQQTLLENSK